MKLYQQICLILTSVLMQDGAVSGHDYCLYNNIEYGINDALYFIDNCLEIVCSYNHRAGVAMDLLPIDYCYCPDFTSREKREAIEFKVNTAHGLYREDSDEVQQLIKRSKRSTDSQMCRFKHNFYAINETIHHNVHHCLILTCVDNGQSALIQYSVMEDCVCETRGACESQPCNNGSCIPRGYEEFICSCHSGYTGPTCETNIDDCHSYACENGGTCIDEVAGFSCDCIDGFDGITCETNIDVCAEVNPCQYGGNCTDEVNGYSCECHSHFQTDNCTNYNFSWNGVNYELGLTKRTWIDAKTDCEVRGGKLATPPSIEEIRIIVDPAIQVLGLVDNIWIGGRVNSDGELIDSLGAPLNDTIASFDASIFSGGECVSLEYNNGDTDFYDDTCAEELLLLCEL